MITFHALQFLQRCFNDKIMMFYLFESCLEHPDILLPAKAEFFRYSSFCILSRKSLLPIFVSYMKITIFFDPVEHIALHGCLFALFCNIS